MEFDGVEVPLVVRVSVGDLEQTTLDRIAQTLHGGAYDHIGLFVVSTANTVNG